MNSARRILGLATLLALLIGLNGCATYSAIQDARGHPESTLWMWDDSNQPTPPRPAYYALVPLTIPVDVATSPLQGIYFFGYPYIIGQQQKGP
jgi:hypothetical protein